MNHTVHEYLDMYTLHPKFMYKLPTSIHINPRKSNIISIISEVLALIFVISKNDNVITKNFENKLNKFDFTHNTVFKQSFDRYVRFSIVSISRLLGTHISDEFPNYESAILRTVYYTKD